jgi:hypothetical protein
MKLFLKKDPMFFVYAYISISKYSKKIKKKLRQAGCDFDSRVGLAVRLRLGVAP